MFVALLNYKSSNINDKSSLYEDPEVKFICQNCGNTEKFYRIGYESCTHKLIHYAPDFDHWEDTEYIDGGANDMNDEWYCYECDEFPCEIHYQGIPYSKKMLDIYKKMKEGKIS